MSERPRPLPAKFKTPYGTRWEKEKAEAGGAHMFDLKTDPKTLGPWILGECVGIGASGRVKIAKHARTGQLAAVKILPLPAVDPSLLCSDKETVGIYREMTMMKLMKHPNIMRIYDVYEGDKQLYLVLEYVEGGELFDYLVNHGKFEHEEALDMFRQIIYGLNYAHTFSIIHRDLKPENILVASVSPPVVKIADWGMAAFAPPSLTLETSCGSPHYASPEIVKGHSYSGTATDIWSCGVILYALLTCTLPFDDKDHNIVLEKVKAGNYEIPPYVDPLVQDLIQRMLVVEPSQRITMPEILLHPWLLSSPNTTTPHLPPSPGILARPIPSRDLVDPDLLKSLLYIWGRHADAQGESIIQDLCSPAGYGVHAKAFYYLLGEYREESGRHKVNEDKSVIWGCDDSKGFIQGSSYPQGSHQWNASEAHLHSIVGNALGQPVIGSNYVPSSPQVGSRTIEVANYPASGFNGVSPEVRPQYLHVRRRTTSPSPMKGAHAPPQHSPERECSPKKVSRMEFARQQQMRMPIPQSKHEQRGRRPKSTIGIPVPSKTETTRGIHARSLPPPPVPRHIIPPDRPLEPLALRKPFSDVTSSYTQARAGRTLRFEADSVTPPSQARDYQWMVLPQENSTAYSREKTIANGKSGKSRRGSRILADEGKENWSPRDDGWQLFEVDDGGQERAAIVTGCDFVKEDENMGIPVTTSTPKRKKSMKDKLPPPDHHPLRRKISLFSLPVSPKNTTAPTHQVSSSTSLFAIKYRVKGWFSNLFNWKNNPDWQHDVLFSPHEMNRTRVEVRQLLARFGVTIEHEIIPGEVHPKTRPLICRVDVLTIGVFADVTLKPTRFRVEFSPLSPLVPFRCLNDSHHLATPPVTPAYPFGSNYGTGMSSPRNSGDEDAYAPKCVIALVHEKGSVSTCRTIWHKLKGFYGDEPIASLGFMS